jgi:hypothetical protein
MKQEVDTGNQFDFQDAANVKKRAFKVHLVFFLEQL